MSDAGTVIDNSGEQERRRRQKYTAHVYLLTSILLIVSFLQWTLIKFFPEVSVYFKGHFFLPLVFLIIALVLITVFVFFEDLRFTIPTNYILVLAIIELVTFGLTSAVVHISFPRFGGSILIVIIMFMIFTAIGIYMPRDITYDIAILFACTIIFFIASILFMSMAVLAGMNFSVLFYGLCIECTAVMFMLYHTQTIHGGRYAEMRYKDSLMATLLLYSDFIILYIITLFLLKASLEKKSTIYAFKDILPQTTTPAATGLMHSPEVSYEEKDP